MFSCIHSLSSVQRHSEILPCCRARRQETRCVKATFERMSFPFFSSLSSLNWVCEKYNGTLFWGGCLRLHQIMFQTRFRYSGCGTKGRARRGKQLFIQAAICHFEVILNCVLTAVNTNTNNSHFFMQHLFEADLLAGFLLCSGLYLHS